VAIGVALGRLGVRSAEVEDCLQRLAGSSEVGVRQAARGALRALR
jgi:hypothetical protein